MPGLRRRAHGAKEGCQATALPQGDRRRRRARRSLRVTQINPRRSRKSGGSAVLAVEHEQQRKGHPAERTTGTANMKLNDFLPRESGEEWVVNRNGNYSMEMFFFEIQDVYPRRSVIGHDNGIAVLRRAG
ncbi:hypothetical protein TcYC6_0003670 [Trypanosoma cruzi]|nr:hypothetical protein TcYC6_0003670 [Trypanosoma cruzi]